MSTKKIVPEASSTSVKKSRAKTAPATPAIDTPAQDATPPAPATVEFKIASRWSGYPTVFTCQVPAGLDSGMALRNAMEQARASRADLYGANLSRANLYGADLYGANLSRANLYGANLYGANLYGANLYGANLSRADLSGADLSRANLYGADLYGADLYGANLSRADLSGADLSRADLYGANLSGADLSGANLSRADLSRADLSEAKNAELPLAQTRILPEGAIIGWKKCRNDVIVKLRIPEEARRSHAWGRKCRAEFADVLEVFGADVGIAKHDGKTRYVAGQRVVPDSWGEDYRVECAPGIHFFITRAEAEAY